MATTPRPLIFERILNISEASKPGMTIQHQDGNGKIFYLRDGKKYYKDATVTSGYWPGAVLGDETEITSESEEGAENVVKDFALDQPVVEEVYEMDILCLVQRCIRSTTSKKIKLSRFRNTS